MATDPSAKSIRPRRTVSMWPRRTTCSMLRSSSSSQAPRVGALAMVGVTERSMRSMMPASSSRRNRSVKRGRRRRGLHHVGDHAEVDDGIRLDQRPVQHPGLAWPHPADGLGVHPALQQPDAGVGRGLAGADDDVLARSLLPAHEVVDRDHPRTVASPRTSVASPPGCRGRGSERRRSGTAAAPRTAVLTRRARRCGLRGTRSRRGTRPGPTRASGPRAGGRSRRRSSAGRPARGVPPRARAPGSVRRPGPSTRRRRTWTTGAAARTGRRAASDLRLRGVGRRGRRARRRGRSGRR